MIHEHGSRGADSIPDLRAHAEETAQIGRKVWEKIGVSGPREAWSLPIHRIMAPHHAEQHGLETDEVVRATTSCWNGCPECVGGLRETLGGLLGTSFIDKHVLDGWFIETAKKAREYRQIELRHLLDGSEELHLGATQDLGVAKVSGERTSVIGLPWTMGLFLSKLDSGSPQLFLRCTDVAGRHVVDPDGVAMGIDEHGFRRLLWFQLLLTGHLVSSRILSPDESNARIDMLYYGARDLRFDDLGMSSRMLDSMRAEGGALRHEALSDVLTWLTGRGIPLRLCIDKKRAGEEKVAELIEQLAQQERFELFTRDISASMHRKTLITPIASLSGSGNLTPSGTAENDGFSNDDEFDFVDRAHDRQYTEKRRSAERLFSKANRVEDVARFLEEAKRFRTEKREREDSQQNGQAEHPMAALIRDIGERGKDAFVEGVKLDFKNYSFVSNLKSPENQDMERLAKALASMLNTRGGSLILGVRDPKHDSFTSDPIPGIGSWMSEFESEDVGTKELIIRRFTSDLCERFFKDDSPASRSLDLDFVDVDGKIFLVYTVKTYSGREPILVHPKHAPELTQKNSHGEGLLFHRVGDESKLISKPSQIRDFYRQWDDRRK